MLKKILYAFSFYFSPLFYSTAGCIIALFCIAYFYPPLVEIGYIAILCFCLLVLIDGLLSFAGRKPLSAIRICSDRFSNGDENKVQLQVKNHRSYKIKVTLIDELPLQFQERDRTHYFVS